MKNENREYTAVIRAWNETTGEIIERGFVDEDDANDELVFLETITENVEIFYRLDWFAGELMKLNGEYWFGKRGEAWASPIFLCANTLVR